MKKPFLWKGKFKDFKRAASSGAIPQAGEDDTIVLRIGDLPPETKPESGKGEKLPGDEKEKAKGKPEEGEESGEPQEGESKEKSGKEKVNKMAGGKELTDEDDRGRSTSGKDYANPFSEETDVETILNEEIAKLDDILPPRWFLTKLKSILKDNTTDRYAGNKLYGDLDFKHLYKISTTAKVFARKEIVSNKQYNIVLLVDCSGSMGDKKIDLAAQSAVSFLKEFQKLCNVAVIGFNVVYPILKPFNVAMKEGDMKDKIEKELLKLCHNDNLAYGNHDHYAIRVSEKVLLPQKGRKIILVLSDGKPICGSNCKYEGHITGYTECDQALKNEIKEVENRGTVVLGLGIMDHAVEEYYRYNEVINNPNEIFEAMVRLLDKSVRRMPVIV